MTGRTLLVVMILGFAGWMFLQTPSPGPVPGNGAREPTAAAPADDATLGFRSDAWFLPDDALLGFVEIPAGPFLMGSDRGGDPLAFDNEHWPGGNGQELVDIRTFFIGRFEVTVAQYGRFVAATGHPAPDEVLRPSPNHPVVNISWPDALAYCRWLETTLKDSPITPSPLAGALDDGWHVSLPNEAEWEKAARGADGRVYPWGAQPRRDRAHFGVGGTAPVGSLPCPECSYGLSDLSGNVWELTRSPYRPYPFQADPRQAPGDDDNLFADALWVMRGGHFRDGPQNIRTAIRGGADPGARRPFIGFRVVITPA